MTEWEIAIAAIGITTFLLLARMWYVSFEAMLIELLLWWNRRRYLKNKEEQEKKNASKRGTIL